MHDKDPFALRDPFGLTPDDWASCSGWGPAHYTGPALLFWALAGVFKSEQPFRMTNPLADLLASLTGDARALAKLASTTTDESIKMLAPALQNLHRRLATATEIALRAEAMRNDDPPPTEAPA